MRTALASVLVLSLVGCSGSDDSGGNSNGTGGGGNSGNGGSGNTGNGGSGNGGGNVPNVGGGGGVTPPEASCQPGTNGTTTVAQPTVLLTLKDRWEGGWLGSPAVADLDGDGDNEIIAPRDNVLEVWNADGSLAFRFEAEGSRIWSSPVIADFRDDAKLEIAFACRENVYLLDSGGNPLSGFPVSWEDELRSIAAGDVDGDGQLDIVATPGHSGPTDVMNAWHANGAPVAGFPPNATGSSGCDDACYLAGCYDQNLAVGDLDGDGKQDVIAPHDNAYASFHKGTGEAFDANDMFQDREKTPGVRYMHDLAEAQQGYAENEDTALQAHFTNTAPAIADIDGDGSNDVVMLGSVQNAAQTNREQGVGLWVLHSDASRVTGWEAPYHAPDYVSGLWDYGDNIVAITNQVTIADIDPAETGPELVFAGFDGKIHAVSAAKKPLWTFQYTTSAEVGTGGVVIGDLTSDGSPEVIFASYGLADGAGSLYILDAGGNAQQTIPLPRRGAQPVPTLADVNKDGTVEIVVSLTDAEDKVESVLVYTVPGSGTNCLLWPTGRGNLLRNGWLP